MARANWKGFVTDYRWMQRVLWQQRDVVVSNKVRILHRRMVRRWVTRVFFIWNRALTIFPVFLNKYVFVLNGRLFFKRYINSAMLDHKYGEIAFTRRYKVNLRVKKVKRKKNE